MVASIAKVLHNNAYKDVDDHKAEILEALGNFDDVEVFGTQVLVACYIQPHLSAGGIIMSAKSQKEDRWQGKTSLVLRFGYEAEEQLKDADVLKRFGGKPLKVGQWVYHDQQAVWSADLKGQGSKMRRTTDTRDQIREWQGWPVRYIYLADIYGRLKLPNQLV